MIGSNDTQLSKFWLLTAGDILTTVHFCYAFLVRSAFIEGCWMDFVLTVGKILIILSLQQTDFILQATHTTVSCA